MTFGVKVILCDFDRRSEQMSLRAKVYVTPRKSVLDPQGKAVSGALHSLGYKEVDSGKYLPMERKY